MDAEMKPGIPWAELVDRYEADFAKLRWCRSGCNAYHFADDGSGAHLAMVPEPEPTGARKRRAVEAAMHKRWTFAL